MTDGPMNEQRYRVLAILTDAAETGAPCPTDTELGAVIGRRDTTVQADMLVLVRRGFIVRQNAGGFGSGWVRRVCIVSTGKWTGFSIPPKTSKSAKSATRRDRTGGITTKRLRVPKLPANLWAFEDDPRASEIEPHFRYRVPTHIPYASSAAEAAI